MQPQRQRPPRRFVLAVWAGLMVALLPVLLWQGLNGRSSSDEVGPVLRENQDYAVWWGLSFAAFVGAGVRALILVWALRRDETANPERARIVAAGLGIVAALGAAGLLILWLGR